MQVAAIEKAAEARGDVIVGWYAEKRSAKAMQRPELDRLRADLATGIARRVYGFRLDRFIRSGPADAYRPHRSTTARISSRVAAAVMAGRCSAV